jgi:hypothetical protein
MNKAGQFATALYQCEPILPRVKGDLDASFAGGPSFAKERDVVP